MIHGGIVNPGLAKAVSWLRGAQTSLSNAIAELPNDTKDNALCAYGRQTLDRLEIMTRGVEVMRDAEVKP